MIAAFCAFALGFLFGKCLGGFKPPLLWPSFAYFGLVYQRVTSGATSMEYLIAYGIGYVGVLLGSGFIGKRRE